MKHLRRLFAAMLILSLLATLTVPALAAGGYTYTVRVFAGAQGTINGQDVYVFENLSYGERKNFDLDMVQLNNDSKYYVKGIRESGKDNNTVDSPSFVVTGDMDYVVAYGIRGSSVAYTVYYQDEAGNELYPTTTYYGNIGDKPVVSFQYVDGYQPQAYNLTRTLSENAAENEFIFVYTPIEGPTAVAPEAPEAGAGDAEADADNDNAAADDGTGDDQNPDEADAADNPADADEANNPGDNANAADQNAPGQNTENISDAETPAAGPEELIDLDDADTPLAEPDAGLLSKIPSLDSIVNAEELALPVKIGFVGGVLLIFGIIAGLVLSRMRKKRKS